MARDPLTVAQKNMKCHFDHKSVQRCFKEGDQVLVLLPIVGSALSGPYEVQRKLSNTDYVICTPDRKRKSRVCHVNMLKAFHTRESPRMEVPLAEDAAVPVPVFVATACGDVDAACDADVEDDGVVSRHTYKQCARFKNSEVLSDLPFHLSHLNNKEVILCICLMTFLLCLTMFLLVPQFCSTILKWVMLFQSNSMHTV